MKRLLLLTWLLTTLLSLPAQTTIDSLFIAAPTEVMPLLSPRARMDMLNLHQYGLEAKAENNMGGKSLMQQKTDEYIEIRLTEVSTLSMRLVRNMLSNTQDSTLICLIHTLNTPATRSQVKFYTTTWQPIEWNRQPKTEQFLSAPDEKTLRTWLTTLRPTYIRAEWAETDRPTLRFSLSLEALSLEDRKEIEPHLRTVDITL